MVAGWERAVEAVLGHFLSALQVNDLDDFAASLAELPDGELALIESAQEDAADVADNEFDLPSLDSLVRTGQGRPLSLLRGVSERVFPVGRLDYHSRGLLLLTNDGELAGALTHPRHSVTKTYHVKFQGKLDADARKALAEGVTLEDGTRTKPAVELLLVKETQTNTWMQIGIQQGLNRQIRRMGEAIGHPVLKLIRVAIGDLGLDGALGRYIQKEKS